jgi:hypothetical protein
VREPAQGIGGIRGELEVSVKGSVAKVGHYAHDTNAAEQRCLVAWYDLMEIVEGKTRAARMDTGTVAKAV